MQTVVKAPQAFQFLNEVAQAMESPWWWRWLSFRCQLSARRGCGWRSTVNIAKQAGLDLLTASVLSLVTQGLVWSSSIFSKLSVRMGNLLLWGSRPNQVKHPFGAEGSMAERWAVTPLRRIEDSTAGTPGTRTGMPA
jgi:hypothetical protein